MPDEEELNVNLSVFSKLNSRLNNVVDKIKIPVKFLPFIITALFLIICISFSANGLLHGDSTGWPWKTENLLSGETDEIGWRGVVPLTTMIFFAPFKLITGNTSAEFLYIYLNIILASLAVFFMYKLTKIISKSDILATIVTLIYGFNYVLLNAITSGKEHGFSQFYLILAFYLLFKGLEDKSKLFLALSGGTIALCMGTREIKLMLLPLYFAFYIFPHFSFKDKKFSFKIPDLKFKLRNFLYLFIPFLIIILLELKFWLGTTIKTMLFGQKTSYGTMLTPILLDLNNIFTMVFSLSFIFALYLIFFKKVYRKISIYFLASLIVFIFVMTANAVYRPRMLLVLFLPFIFVGSIGLEHIFKKSRLIGMILLLFILISTFATAYPVIKYRHDTVGTKEFFMYMEETTEPNSLILISGYYWIFVDYYANREFVLVESEELLPKLTAALDEGRPVYTTWSSAINYGGQPLLDYLDSNYQLSKVGSTVFEGYLHTDQLLDPTNETLIKISPKE